MSGKKEGGEGMPSTRVPIVNTRCIEPKAPRPSAHVNAPTTQRNKACQAFLCTAYTQTKACQIVDLNPTLLSEPARSTYVLHMADRQKMWWLCRVEKEVKHSFCKTRKLWAAQQLHRLSVSSPPPLFPSPVLLFFFFFLPSFLAFPYPAPSPRVHLSALSHHSTTGSHSAVAGAVVISRYDK